MSITTWGWGAGSIGVFGFGGSQQTVPAPSVPGVLSFDCARLAILETVTNALQVAVLGLALKEEFRQLFSNYTNKAEDLTERVETLEREITNIVDSDDELKKKVQ